MTEQLWMGVVSALASVIVALAYAIVFLYKDKNVTLEKHHAYLETVRENYEERERFFFEEHAKTYALLRERVDDYKDALRKTSVTDKQIKATKEVMEDKLNKQKTPPYLQEGGGA